MTDLIKELRELLKKIDDNVCEICKDPNKFVMTIPPEKYDTDMMITRVTRELGPHLLDTLKQASLNVEASQKAARAYCDELARYKKALELCREQRNYYLDTKWNSEKTITGVMRESDNKAIDQILEGEVSQ